MAGRVILAWWRLQYHRPRVASLVILAVFSVAVGFLVGVVAVFFRLR